MTEGLEFTELNGTYVCRLDNSTPNSGGVIQVVQKTRGIVSVSANIPGMPPSVVAVYDNPYGNSVIFQLDLPSGVEVTIKSGTEVERAVWMS